MARGCSAVTQYSSAPPTVGSGSQPSQRPPLFAPKGRWSKGPPGGPKYKVTFAPAASSIRTDTNSEAPDLPEATGRCRIDRVTGPLSAARRGGAVRFLARRGAGVG